MTYLKTVVGMIACVALANTGYTKSVDKKTLTLDVQEVQAPFTYYVVKVRATQGEIQ